MDKHGAVKCPNCESCDVEWVKTADTVENDGSQVSEETYECRSCQKRFLKPV